MNKILFVIILVTSLINSSIDDYKNIHFKNIIEAYNEVTSIPGLSYIEPTKNTYFLGFFTHDVRRPFYYMPDDEVINDLISLINEINFQDETPMWWQGHDRLLGCYLVHENVYYETWSNGIVVALSTIAPYSSYAVAPELNGKIQFVLQNALNITPFEPESIKDIISARLDLKFIRSPRRYTQTITDITALSDIESMLSGAGRDGMSSCPFYEAFLTLTLADGENIFLALASDSCCQYMVNGMCFNYKPAELRGVLDSGGNEMLFKYFDKVPIDSRGE